MPKEIISIGICLGASTVSVIRLTANILEKWPDEEEKKKQKPQIIEVRVHPHDGNPKRALSSILESIPIDARVKVAATGRKFRTMLNLTTITEAEAVEHAYQYVKLDHVESPAIVSAGGETFMVYILDKKGKISGVRTGSKCASGTGEFFMQQLRRMDISLETTGKWGTDITPYRVSDRCSVFCKSDCTHATNKGIPKKQVTAGLCLMMAHKVLELLNTVPKKNIMITGGTSLNHMMTEHLRRNIDQIIIPEEATYFEALGVALWAIEHETTPFGGIKSLFKPGKKAFTTLLPLRQFENKVSFAQMSKKKAEKGDSCILGVDVGSTTTKAVLLRKNDNSILASVYLRTNGDPVRAARECYRTILKEIEEIFPFENILIHGIGICGSGRQIAGIHAGTKGIINEITAHATAAVFFDPKVDTIFEIGGQDAKYTYIVNGTPSDYAMNEACSAGTGSFLEESAFETLNLPMNEIADVALKGEDPPNFNDQCAAFIASDIKNSIHEGVKKEDIVAGLVYSICMNYCNRVKGNRPYGEKVFMQGGVCYNRAVPLAMAGLIDKPIIVPPEPGLMGAFGAALEIKNRIDNGIMDEQIFDIRVLIDRDVQYRSSFICSGGSSGCDRRCKIERIQFGDAVFPFGGACNRFSTTKPKNTHSSDNFNAVQLRQSFVFSDPPSITALTKGTVGINRSFLIHTYYPLFSTFFSNIGYKIVMPDEPSQIGIDSRNASFCYPAELSHGFFHTLLTSHEHLDYLFLPHLRSIPSQMKGEAAQVCPLVQGESFFLKTTFKELIDKKEKKGMRILSPLIDLESGIENINSALMQAAGFMSVKGKMAKQALNEAIRNQKAFFDKIEGVGKKFLNEMKLKPSEFSIVIFGRPYNAFAKEAHMGIPRKFSSRGISVIPMDFLPSLHMPSKEHMYWGMGQRILKTAQFVGDHPNLYAVYITNFSCGPDSFLINYFRSIMKDKPSLTLEMDSHTADAGLETRIEAFLDIIKSHQKLNFSQTKENKINALYSHAEIFFRHRKGYIRTSDKKEVKLTDPNVTLLFPSMGKLSSEAISSVFNGFGFHAKAHPPSNENILKLGRGNTLCKECLPLILTAGTLINYVRNERKDNEILVYFMPTGSGPCRFGQYSIFMKDLIKRLEIKDVSIFSLSSDDGYSGLTPDFHRMSWWGVVIADVFEDIRSMLLANAQNKSDAMQIFEDVWSTMLKAIEKKDYNNLKYFLRKSSDILGKIQLRMPSIYVPRISLIGEIFVRRDGISRQYITEYLAEKGFAVTCSPISEWIYYTNHFILKGYGSSKESLKKKMNIMIKQKVMKNDERMIKSILSCSKLIPNRVMDISSVIHAGEPYISPHLGGEAILTIGTAIEEIISHSCGVISIGPFGCMPNRLSESILNEIMKARVKRNHNSDFNKIRAILDDSDLLPFLSIESDGSNFPQPIHSKLETFCLNAKRLHEKIFSLFFN